MNSQYFNSGNKLLLLVLLFFLLTILSSCGTTKLTASWYDTNYQGQNTLKKVLVIAVTKEETIRRLYEDSFVAKLGTKGIQAVPSYSLSNPDVEPEKAAIELAVKEAGAHSVLITRHLGTDTKQHYRPPERIPVYSDPFYGGMYGYYPMAYREVYSPGYTYSVTTVNLEANLYEASSGNLIWAARSESVDPKISDKFILELVEVFAADLKKSGLL